MTSLIWATLLRCIATSPWVSGIFTKGGNIFASLNNRILSSTKESAPTKSNYFLYRLTPTKKGGSNASPKSLSIYLNYRICSL